MKPSSASRTVVDVLFGSEAACRGGPSVFKIPCPLCQASLRVAAELAGRRIRCPRCKLVFSVPEPDTEDASVPMQVEYFWGRPEASPQAQPAADRVDSPPKRPPHPSHRDLPEIQPASGRGTADANQPNLAERVLKWARGPMST